MAHGDGAAVDVDAGGVDAERLHEAQHHGGEGLVDLEEVDVADLHAALAQDLFGHRHRAGQHDRRVGADLGGGPDAGARLQAVLLAEVPGADQHRRRAVDDAGGVAGVVDVVDALEVRVLQDRHRVEAGHHLAHLLERRLERAERLHVGAGAHVLVAVEDRQAVDVLHRHDRAGEAALLPGPGGAPLALDGEASQSSREKPNSVAMMSAAMPCGTK